MSNSFFEKCPGQAPARWLLPVLCWLFFWVGNPITSHASTKQQRPLSPIVKQPQREDSTHAVKPSVLTIKTFAADITKPLPSATATIQSKATGKTEQFPLLNGKLERTFTKPDELVIEVSAEGYTAVRRTMTIAVSSQGNRYEFDAQLDRITVGLTVWAMDRQTGKVIKGARFSITGQAIGTRPTALPADSLTGLSKINLPGKGMYTLSGTAEGYPTLTKPIKLDSLQNEARFVLQIPSTTAPKTPVKPAPTVPAAPTTAQKAGTDRVAKVVTPTSPPTVATTVAQPLQAAGKGRPVKLENIYFDQSSPVLRPESYPELDQLASALMANPTTQIEIRGHTDNQGDFDLNVKLSRDRCQAIIDYLVGKGVAKTRLRAVGRGPIDPVAPNTTEANRRKNRRVEFVVI